MPWTAIGTIAGIIGVFVAILAWQAPKGPAPGGQSGGTSASERSGTASQPTLESNPPAAPVIRRQGLVVLAHKGRSIDLNSPASDASWGANSEAGPDTDRMGLYFSSLHSPGVETARLEDPVSYERCRNATNYVDSYIETDKLTDEYRYCLHLTSGRYATLFKVKQTEDSITLKIIVWEQN